MDRGAQLRRPREGLCSFSRIAERSYKTDPRGVLACSEASPADIGNGRRANLWSRKAGKHSTILALRQQSLLHDEFAWVGTLWFSP